MKSAIVTLGLICSLSVAAQVPAQSVAQPDAAKDDFSAFHGDQRTLIHALHLFEKALGGRVVDFRFADLHGHPGYRADLHAARHAAVSLTAAIRTAEQSQNGAPAVAAGIARSASNPTSEVQAYTVLLDVNGGVQSVSVDTSTGEVIANPGALSY